MKARYALLSALMMTASLAPSQHADLNGTWRLLKEGSANLDYFQYMTVAFAVGEGRVSVTRELGPKRKAIDRVTASTDGRPSTMPVSDRTFLTNLYMGLKLPPHATKEVSATWDSRGRLVIRERFDVMASQGMKKIEMSHLFELEPGNEILRYSVERKSRNRAVPLTFRLKRAGFHNAYTYQMTDDWEIGSGLPVQACMISLQGIVNEAGPNLYLLYGPKYAFNYTGELFQFLGEKRHFTFTRLGSLEQALRLFKDQVKGYIVWDTKVRTSLIVAYTLAGLEKGIVISEELIPLAQRMGLKAIDDFRGRFAGQSDFEIFTWAYRNYWHRCTKDLIVWLGGEHGTLLLPGVADYGMMRKSFFTDLSARESDTLEYGLTKQLLSGITPLGMVMGWHSYKKDLEEEWVTLTSSYGLTVDGLHTLPNTSFLCNVPASPGFRFTNRHNVRPGETYIPKKKVYVALVQTDGLGIGAWVKPGRGSIPYAWEVSMKFHYLSPAMMEYFYSQATPNDYFIGCLSGSSYMYPKAFPKKWLNAEIANAYRLMDSLDLRVFEIMDYSADRMEAGNNELTREIVDAYYRGMPGAIGFLNGYFASHTFTVREKRPFISYDYYLSAEKPEAEAAADLEELAALNDTRPYYLLVHVRENSDVARVKSICDRLGAEFEIVPLDIFLKYAGENPTFKERYLGQE